MKFYPEISLIIHTWSIYIRICIITPPADDARKYHAVVIIIVETREDDELIPVNKRTILVIHACLYIVPCLRATILMLEKFG